MFAFGAGDDDHGKMMGTVFSFLGGAMYGAAWWVYVDGTAYGVHLAQDKTTEGTAGYTWILGIVSTLAYLMINGMKWSELVNEDDRAAQNRARLFLIFSVLLQLIALAVSGYIMGIVFLNHADAYHWGGISLFVSQMLMFLGCWLQRLTTLPDKDSF